MLIFVYGILRKGYENNFLLGNSKYLGSYYTLDKFHMVYDQNLSYPILLTKSIFNEDTSNYIYGDVFEINDDIYKKLEIYTDNKKYNLNRIEIKSVNQNKNIFAYIYLLNNDCENNIINIHLQKYITLKPIPSGDWSKK